MLCLMCCACHAAPAVPGCRLVDVDMQGGSVLHPYIWSLGAFWPGLQALAGKRAAATLAAGAAAGAAAATALPACAAGSCGAEQRT